LNFHTIATSMVSRPLPLFNYAATVGIHSSLLLFTALFLPRTSLLIFSNTSDFPLLRPVSSLDRPQPEFFEAITASPPLTLAWLCTGVSLISFSWGGRIRRQAYEQRRPADKTDFEAKEAEMEWRKQGITVRLRPSSRLSITQALVEPAQITCLNSPGYCPLSRDHRGLRRPNHEARLTVPSTLANHSPNLAATISKRFCSHSSYVFSHISRLPMFLGLSPSRCSAAETLMSC
jgi:hypothetical protein